MNISEKAYEVLHSDELGRYVVAARDLQAGEEFLCEEAVVVGPKHHTSPMCLGCHAPTSGHITCAACGWPVCGEECAQLPAHRDAECAVFQAAQVKFGPPPEDPEADCPQLECITPLRLLLKTDTDRWKDEISLMEDHKSEREGGSDWNADQVNIVTFLLNHCKLAQRYSEELVHKICGILAVNAFEAHSHSERGDNSLRAIFPQLALLAHSCVPNTAHSIDQEYRVHVRTTVTVRKGEPLYTTYTRTLHPTHERREHLRLSKYFDCKCPRCGDPKELGSHLSTFKCPKCEWGWVIPATPLDQSTDWTCDKCAFTMPNQSVFKVLQILRREAEMLADDDIEGREALIKKYRGSLHPRHAHMVALKYSLSQLYGRVEEYTFADMPDLLMERKIELCREILAVADVVEPGMTRLRGMTLYELHAPLIMLARSQFQQGVLEGSKLVERMREAEAALSEAVTILSLEQPGSTERQLAEHGHEALRQLSESVKALPGQLGLTSQ